MYMYSLSMFITSTLHITAVIHMEIDDFIISIQWARGQSGEDGVMTQRLSTSFFIEIASLLKEVQKAENDQSQSRASHWIYQDLVYTIERYNGT